MQKSDYSLTAGMKFGDLSLEGSSSGRMRSATIVTNFDTHFAVLKRSDYDVFSSSSGNHEGYHHSRKDEGKHRKAGLLLPR